MHSLICAKFIMSKNSDPNVITKNQSTTMLTAATLGNLNVMKLLLNLEDKYQNSFNWVCYMLYVITYKLYLVLCMCLFLFVVLNCDFIIIG